MCCSSRAPTDAHHRGTASSGTVDAVVHLLFLLGRLCFLLKLCCGLCVAAVTGHKSPRHVRPGHPKQPRSGNAYSCALLLMPLAVVGWMVLVFSAVVSLQGILSTIFGRSYHLFSASHSTSSPTTTPLSVTQNCIIQVTRRITMSRCPGPRTSLITSIQETERTKPILLAVQPILYHINHQAVAISMSARAIYPEQTSWIIAQRRRPSAQWE